MFLAEKCPSPCSQADAYPLYASTSPTECLTKNIHSIPTPLWIPTPTNGPQMSSMAFHTHASASLVTPKSRREGAFGSRIRIFLQHVPRSSSRARVWVINLILLFFSSARFRDRYLVASLGIPSLSSQDWVSERGVYTAKYHIWCFSKLLITFPDRFRWFDRGRDTASYQCTFRCYNQKITLMLFVFLFFLSHFLQGSPRCVDGLRIWWCV